MSRNKSIQEMINRARSHKSISTPQNEMIYTPELNSTLGHKIIVHKRNQSAAHKYLMLSRRMSANGVESGKSEGYQTQMYLNTKPHDDINIPKSLKR